MLTFARERRRKWSIFPVVPGDDLDVVIGRILINQWAFVYCYPHESTHRDPWDGPRSPPLRHDLYQLARLRAARWRTRGKTIQGIAVTGESRLS